MAKRKDPRTPAPVLPAAAEAALPTLPAAPQLPVIEAPSLTSPEVVVAPSVVEPVVATVSAAVAPVVADVATPAPQTTAKDQPRPNATTSPASEPARPRPLIRLAAGLAGAAAIGALLGSIGSAGVTRLAATAPAAAPAHDLRIPADLSRDIAALKTSVEALSRGTNTQLSKFSDRLDTLAKAQAEPNAKIAKLNEAIDRLERRSAAAIPATQTNQATAPDVTGSVPTQTAAAQTVLPPVPKLQDRIVPGWVLRDIYRGRAVVESRLGIYEVSPGANLPGIGPVETIRRQDGHWVVVTPKGLIVSNR